METSNNVKIVGSKDKVYSVNISEMTCTCKDWTCRRHNFPVGDDRRLCKHLREAMDLESHIKVDQSHSPVMSESEVTRITNIVDNEDNIVRYELCIKSGSNSLIYRLVRDIDNYETYLASEIGYRKVVNNVYTRDGTYMKLIKCNPYNYILNKLIYTKPIDELVRISSILNKKFGYRISNDGFIDESGKIIEIEVFSDEEFQELIN